MSKKPKKQAPPTACSSTEPTQMVKSDATNTSPLASGSLEPTSDNLTLHLESDHSGDDSAEKSKMSISCEYAQTVIYHAIKKHVNKWRTKIFTEVIDPAVQQILDGYIERERKMKEQMQLYQEKLNERENKIEIEKGTKIVTGVLPTMPSVMLQDENVESEAQIPINADIGANALVYTTESISSIPLPGELLQSGQ